MDLESLGVRTVPIALNDSGFDPFITALNPKVVLFDRYLTEEQFGWRVAACVPGALRILDTEDLHSLRNAREKAFKANKPFTKAMWLQDDLTKREVASIYRCDLSLVISTFEVQLLRSETHISEGQILHLPFMLDRISEKKMGNWPSFGERRHFMFIGTGKHAPNMDAILWLKQDIWPMIRKSLPQAEIHIYGSYLPERVHLLHCPSEGFYVDGFLKNVQEAMERTRVCLAPLRFGAGIKGKLIDSMVHGMPSVTTAIGAEGTHGGLSWNGSVENTAAGLAEAAVALYTDPKEWEAAQKNGIKIINTLYQATVLGQKLTDKIQTITHDLEGHRSQNFLGAMLLHHTMASTKYMSKWIEAKNGLDNKKKQ